MTITQASGTWRAHCSNPKASRSFGEAQDGASAVEAAGQLQPQVVLLDVQLPDTDGFDVARRLTAANAAEPAVVLTSSRDAQDFGPLIEESGARGFIPKAELSGAALFALLG